MLDWLHKKCIIMLLSQLQMLSLPIVLRIRISYAFDGFLQYGLGISPICVASALLAHFYFFAKLLRCIQKKKSSFVGYPPFW